MAPADTSPSSQHVEDIQMLHEHSAISVGDKYIRVDAVPRQIAEVTRVLDDPAGVPHVQFTLFVERGTSTVEDGPRTLAATSFLKLYTKPA